MITYTIVVAENSMIAHDGILPRARLRYYAGNLRVYTRGHVPVRKLDRLMHMALELCAAHHIPMIQLKRYIAEGGEK